MKQSQAWLEAQGWSSGQGLGKNKDGIASPVVMRTQLGAGDAYDFNYFSHMYSAALAKIGTVSEEEQKKRDSVALGGLFVKATGSYVKPAPVVENEQELLDKCKGRTARRSVKRLALSEEEIAQKTSKDKVDKEKKKKDEKKKKKKKAKKRKKDEDRGKGEKKEVK